MVELRNRLLGKLLQFVLRHLPSIGLVDFPDKTIFRENGELPVTLLDPRRIPEKRQFCEIHQSGDSFERQELSDIRLSEDFLLLLSRAGRAPRGAERW